MLLFMYISKRVHKEVFAEHKKSAILQTEYKTIYDELEESIFVLKDDKITHLNTKFKKFLIRFIGVEQMQHIQKSPELAEYNEMIKYNEKNKKIS